MRRRVRRDGARLVHSHTSEFGSMTMQTLTRAVRIAAAHAGHVLKILWRFVDRARRATVNLLFIALAAALLFALAYRDVPDFADETALVLEPNGVIVEQLAAKTPSIGSLMGGGGEETLLRDLLETLELAAEDEDVSVLVLDLSKLQGGGMSKLQELGAALDAFKKTSGKKIIATADNYSQAAYYLAAHADEVYMHQMGQVSIVGLARYQTYFKDAIDQLEVQWNIFRVGKFKSAVEPYLGNEMSPAAREANLAWMSDLWDAYLEDVSMARGIDESLLSDYVQNFDRHLDRANGDSALAAKNLGLVDHIGGRDLVRGRVIELVGEDDDTHTFHQIGGGEYLAYARDRDGPLDLTRPRVAVIVARGTIMDGEQPPGTIGGDSIAALVRKARLDENVKALVLRVDSGGGSAFASEVIRREFELARAAGKPVVVSMGSVAASGGYWISTASDEIWASPTTITGSIGIFGMFPTFERTLGRVGVHSDGVATGPFAGTSVERGIDERVAASLQRGIEHGYHEFLSRVAKARGMTIEEVDAVAQGRVWSGVDAHAHGLVDQLGGLEQAIASAAKRAELEEGEFEIDYVSKDLDFKDKVLGKVLGETAEAAEQAFMPIAGDGPYAEIARFLAEQARTLASFNDPRGVYAYSFIDVD